MDRDFLGGFKNNLLDGLGWTFVVFVLGTVLYLVMIILWAIISSTAGQVVIVLLLCTWVGITSILTMYDGRAIQKRTRNG